MAKLILRSKIKYLINLYRQDPVTGVILSGVIGSGKTTVAELVCKELSLLGFDVLRFDGDDVQFRAKIRANTRFFLEEIVERGLERPFIFVDEVQKEPEIFDAIKIAFDKKKASFMVSGSNPAFLHTTAKDRLQRRGQQVSLFPISIPEIEVYGQNLKEFEIETFGKLLWPPKKNPLSEPLPLLRRPATIEVSTKSYLIRGGLPLSVKSSDVTKALTQIKLSVERGVTDTYSNTIAVADEVRRYLAMNNSREFTYQGIHQKIRTTKRFVVDEILDHLINHGYLFKKRPYLESFETSKSTYLASYSWVDPGMVTYFQGDLEPSEQELGFRLESYVHTRLIEQLEMIPVSSQIYYHKPFDYKATIDALAFKPGEVDFIVQIGESIIPIEVKLTSKLSEIDTGVLKSYLKKYKRPYGMILYGGSPHVDTDAKIIYFPYWYI